MKLEITGSAKEIAALVAALQERRDRNVKFVLDGKIVEKSRLNNQVEVVEC